MYTMYVLCLFSLVFYSTMHSKLDRFREKCVLNSCNEVVSKVYLGEIDGEVAILIVNKMPVGDELALSGHSTVIHQNDIFTSGILESNEKMKYSIIHPATDALIKKYTKSERITIRETYTLYRDRILPLALEKGPNTLWIDNIFRQAQGHSAPYTTESKEEVLYLDNDFLICPDLKWDRISKESLYLLVLIKDRRIYTIRELTDAHIPLLERIEYAVEGVLKTYGYNLSQVKVYFHYYPTFYRAHIHVSAITASVLGRSVGTSVLLHEVIENLKIAGDYYKKRTMEIEISKESYIYEGYKQTE